jgi:type IV pilus assembly protein PilB
MLELEYFSNQQFTKALREAKLDIRIGDLLVELGDLSTKELEAAIRLQKEPSSDSNRKKKLGEILIEQRFIKESRLIDVLANHLGYLNIEPDFSAIDKKVLAKITAQQCEQFGFIPVSRQDDGFIVCCTDPKNTDTREMAERLLDGPVTLAISSQHTLAIAINKFKSVAMGGKPTTLAADESKISRAVDEVLQAAIALGASDIHWEPTVDKLRIRFRRDGVLWHYKDYPVDQAQTFLARLKVMSKANIAERRRHQDGKIEYADPDSGQIIDIRCSFYISIHGEKACLRLLNRKAELLNIEEIGMAPSVLERFKFEALHVPTGVVLITGPTGSGKTTTLYGCVDYLNNDETSIITAEEPVEYVIEGITQCSLNPKIDMTFAETLRHMVRQDPDVIVLGEIRDRESAEAAIQSALTGHKVLTTFHTEDTIGGLLRLMNMNIETFLISSTVVSVLAQRLLRRVCSLCEQPYRPTPLEMQRLGLGPDDLRISSFKVGAGCESCHYSGYRGRVSVFELLVLDERVKDAILGRKASYDIRRISIESSGLITLLEDGLEKASRGQTTLTEVLRVLPRLDKPRSLMEIRRLCRIGDA